jgi:serpin B
MIPNLVDSFDPATVMALINAVTFDADWKQEYAWANEVDNWFTAYDGTKQKASVLSSSNLPYEHAERYYLSDEHSTGFLKYYADGRYAFAAILPEEGMTTTEYINTLTADSLHNMLANPEYVNVHTSMPEFSYEYEIQLPKILSEMGMPSMFGGGLNRMTDGDNDYSVSEVMQKTFIDVNKKGTRAAAATMAVIAESAAFSDKEVICNRPFVYCIVDTETSLPMFIGTVETLN